MNVFYARKSYMTKNFFLIPVVLFLPLLFLFLAQDDIKENEKVTNEFDAQNSSLSIDIREGFVRIEQWERNTIKIETIKRARSIEELNKLAVFIGKIDNIIWVKAR